MAESRTLKKLTHPNIVQFISSFRDRKDQNNDENSGFFYIIMESLDGGALHTVLRAPQCANAKGIALLIQCSVYCIVYCPRC